MEFMYGILIFFLISVFLISSIKKTRTADLKENQKQLDLINNEIEIKQKQLTQINQQIDNKTLDRSVSLSKVSIKVLDMYDHSGIKVPADILEDLSVIDLEDEKEVMDYIENQRYYWKLENTKKVFKK